MKTFAFAFLAWLPLGFAITCLIGFTYVSYQQTGRQMANDPQIRMAEDGALMLAKDNTPAAIVPRGTLIDIGKSIAPWIAVYDSKGLPLESSAFLDNAPPQPPIALFDESTWIGPKTYHTPAGNETRVTWQPRENVRQAIVLVHAANGEFVVSGRSLRDTEGRVAVFGVNSLIAWFVTVVGSLFFALVYAFFKTRA